MSYSHAQSEGVVVTEGAMVFESADFDSAVIGYFPSGHKVQVSKKRYGPFYRLKFKQGVFGYVSDADVVVGDQARSLIKRVDEVKDKIAEKQALRKGQHPYTTFYLGPLVSYVMYRELVARQIYSDSVFFYGAKASFPAPLMGGSFWMDVMFLYRGTPPAYYNQVSSIAPSGFIMLGEIELKFILDDFASHRGYYYLGAGPAVAFSRILVDLNGSKSTLEEIRAGLVVSGGVAYRLDPVIFKFEPRYYLERTQYLGVSLMAQYGF